MTEFELPRQQPITCPKIIISVYIFFNQRRHNYSRRHRAGWGSGWSSWWPLSLGSSFLVGRWSWRWCLEGSSSSGRTRLSGSGLWRRSCESEMWIINETSFLHVNSCQKWNVILHFYSCQKFSNYEASTVQNF